MVTDIHKILRDNHWTISVMESCTGGLLSSLLTDVEGASDVLKSSFVTYSNDAKIRLGVDPEIIKAFGVYSVKCAEKMALAAAIQGCANIGVGITGTTGNVDKNNVGDAGICYISVVINDPITLTPIEKQNMVVELYPQETRVFTREEIKKQYAKKALCLIYTVLENFTK